MNGRTEYIIMRIARRLVPRVILSSLHAIIPHYKPSVGLSDSERIVENYHRLLEKAGRDIRGATILEIGCGQTNGSGYSLISKGARRWYGFDPYVTFDAIMDRKQLNLYNKHVFPETHRFGRLGDIAPECVDAVFSNSVLEHVREPFPLFSDLHRVLKPGAFMIHCIDYRDHFFKYPYHFLLFSKKTWDTFLNPGDLFRYRVSDHVNIMKNAGFKVNVLTGSKDSLEFEKIRTMVHPDFNGYSQEELMTTYSELFAEKAGA